MHAHVSLIKKSINRFDARIRNQYGNNRNGVIIILCIGVKLNQLKSNENVISTPRENNCPGIATRYAAGRIYISDALFLIICRDINIHSVREFVYSVFSVTQHHL